MPSAKCGMKAIFNLEFSILNAVDFIHRYGILVDPKFVFVFLEDPYNWPCTTLVVGKYVILNYYY